MNKELKWKFFLVAILVAFFGLSIYKNGLKPGIDLAGGSTYLYEIDMTGIPEAERRGISEDMIRILRDRIDPSNQLNLIWRPHGVDKIEIQVPLATQETREFMKAYKDKLAELDKSGINMISVKQALVHPEGKSQEEYVAGRTEQFAALAGDNAERKVLLDELAEVYDSKEAARAQQAEALEVVDSITKQAKEADVQDYQLSSLVRRWDSLDDPNKISEVNKLAKDDAALADQVRKYVSARKEVSQLREKLTGEDGLIEQVEEKLRSLERSNINIERFEKYLAAEPKRRAEELRNLVEAHPGQETLIREIEAAYDKYASVSGRLDDPEDLKRMLRGSGVLEFRILPKSDAADIVVSDYMNKLAEFGPVKASTDKYVWRQIRDIKTFKTNAIIGQFVDEYYVLCSNKDTEKLVGSGDNTWKLKSAYPDQDQFGAPAVAFAFNATGADRFYELTKNNVERPLCILLDDKAISAPNINQAISARGIITGSFTYKEVVELADKLKAGSLPARLSDEPISENNIGPTLGKDNLHAGFKAGVIGLVAVIIFMLIYYTFAGALADIALTLNMLFIIGVMAFSKATFTMPGIAALILTVGMAVDANVLIFERVREEMKSGSSLKIAIKNGYDRAFWTIFDANLTTFIVALILWVMTSEEIKGFALALMIGIVSSMFTALFVTRAIFEWLLDSDTIHDKLNMMHLMDHPSVKWMNLKPAFWICSGLLVASGWFFTATRTNDSNSLFSIEFTGGTSAQIRLNMEKAMAELLTADQQKLDMEEIGLILRGKVEEMVSQGTDDPEIAACRVQQVGAAENLEYEIITTATNLASTVVTPGEGDPTTAADVEAKFKQVAEGMGDDRLANTTFEQIGSTFKLVTHQTSVNVVKKALERAFPNATYTEPVVNNLVGNTIIEALGDYLNVIKNLSPANVAATPITEDLISKKPYLGAYSGGVLLTADFAPGKNETLDRIKDRFERTQLLTSFEDYDYYDSVFFAPDNTGADQPLGSIEMVTRSDEVVYGISSDDEWKAFVANETGRFKEALELQTSFTRLTQIDPSVGSKSMTDAIISIVVSLMAIVAYIWFRFGNIRFGLAAVTALVHDVSISLGLVALTAAISNTALGRMLMISDFKIDLPIIAAFLTVIGYSLNDTIVVFDRIRENRGKKTVLTGDMINTSINQTLSRTVLTSLTTLLVLIVMYIWGGTGLRGFNFVLIIGVIVGTYSSVAIAAPLLQGAVDIEPEEESGPVSEGVAMN